MASRPRRRHWRCSSVLRRYEPCLCPSVTQILRCTTAALEHVMAINIILK